MLRFCKNCGTLYNDRDGACPKCTEKDIFAEDGGGHAVNAEMSEEEQKRARRRSWIELIVGIPLFIGIIYLVIYLFKLAGA